MDDTGRKARYYSYLLRCWETAPDDDRSASAWRFSLEDPHSGARRNFAGLESLVAALESELQEAGGEDGQPHDWIV